MSLASRTLAMLVLAAALAACGGASLPPPAQSTQAPVASDGAQQLAAGTYRTQFFQPTLTYTVPEGWELLADTPNWVQLRPQGSQDIGLYLFRDARAASQAASCPTEPEPGVGTTSTELVAHFRGLPGVNAGQPALVTVGGLRGSQLDMGIAPGWTASCPFANGVPTVPLIMNEGIDRWVLAGDERLRFYILDVPGGGNVIVDIDDFMGDQIDGLIKSATPIIKSFEFEVSSESASPEASSVASPSVTPVLSPVASAAP
ncbi:MAG TPA: hypothetical protein VFY23_00185 [Candidatus Limnocylindrales bacterium]|nr:hypothetical protein [Candidatus Limnocylindrales bacterium]